MTLVGGRPLVMAGSKPRAANVNDTTMLEAVLDDIPLEG